MYCQNCGTEIQKNETKCSKCETPIGQEIKPVVVVTGSDDKAMRYVLPIGRSGIAIAAGYVALFAILIVPAPLALVLGIWALIDINKHPEKLGKGRAFFAIVMGVLGTVFMAYTLLVELFR